MKIGIDQETYDNYLIQIENLVINQGRIEESMNLLKTTNFDKTEYEELDDLRRKIKERIREKRNIINNAVIVEKLESDIILISDIVKIKTYYDEEDYDIDTLELTYNETDLTSIIKKISLESPLGKALYKSKVNDTVFYTVNNNEFKVEILEKMHVKKLSKTQK